MSTLDAYRGRTTIVTGAGDGIGAMLARQLAAAGMRVGVLDIRADAADAICTSIGGDTFPLVADVSDRSSVMAAAETFRTRGEALSLLWINAGVGAGATLIGGNPRVVEWAFGVNVLGAVWTAQAFAPLVLEATGPRHVGVTASSVCLRDPDMPLTLYGTTKHGTFAVAEALRNELAPSGVGVTILCPGLLNTDIWDAARARPDRFGGVRRMDPAIAGQWRAAKPPELMWPHIERTIADGGGYLACATDPSTRTVFDSRTTAIGASIVDI